MEIAGSLFGEWVVLAVSRIHIVCPWMKKRAIGRLVWITTFSLYSATQQKQIAEKFTLFQRRPRQCSRNQLFLILDIFHTNRVHPVFIVQTTCSYRMKNGNSIKMTCHFNGIPIFGKSKLSVLWSANLIKTISAESRIYLLESRDQSSVLLTSSLDLTQKSNALNSRQTPSIW